MHLLAFLLSLPFPSFPAPSTKTKRRFPAPRPSFSIPSSPPPTHLYPTFRRGKVRHIPFSVLLPTSHTCLSHLRLKQLLLPPQKKKSEKKSPEGLRDRPTDRPTRALLLLACFFFLGSFSCNDEIQRSNSWKLKFCPLFSSFFLFPSVSSPSHSYSVLDGENLVIRLSADADADARGYNSTSKK